MTLDITLIICTYRRPAAVVRLLESLLCQTRPLSEILIVDGSPDTMTQQAVEQFCLQRNARICYHHVSPEHRGLTRQRNYGIARARGAIVAFLDDDTLPEPDYVAELLSCFERHPDAVGVGGYIVGELQWRKVDRSGGQPLSVYRFGDWECREDYRWRLRKLLGLGSSLPPGWMPTSGHGRTIGNLPPDGADHRVEAIIGCALAVRRDVLDRHKFSHYFEGYGLYEDLDFCIRVSQDGPLYVCTRAQLSHYHAPSGRPNQFRYGTMVTRNGWFVWRRRWPNPQFWDRLRWWTITTLLILCRFGDALRGPRRPQALSEAIGRIWGLISVMRSKPTLEN